jgi:hypothetical protein
LIPKGEFCNHKINYFPEPETALPLPTLLAVLNSKLTDWYFRLGSTSASVSHYQVYNLPAPVFETPKEGSEVPAPARKALDKHHWDEAFRSLEPAVAEPPFLRGVIATLTFLVDEIVRIERARGDIARTERSALAPESQPYQDMIDRLLYRMAGLGDDEVRGLEARLATML